MRFGRVGLPALATAAALSACSGGSGAMPPGPRPSQAASAVPTATATVTAATPSPTATATVAAATPSPTATATTGPIAATPAASPSATVAFVPHATFGCDVFAPPMFSPPGVICRNGGDGSFEFSSFFELYDTNAATTSKAMLTVDHYHANPGSFAVPGTVFAAAQYTFDDTPAALTASTIDLELGYVLTSLYDPPAVRVAGTTFTCTIYGGSRLIGSATGIVPSSTRRQPNDAVGCIGVDGSRLRPTTDPSTAVVPLPSTFFANQAYTVILSF